MRPFRIRRCYDHRSCWLIHRQEGSAYVPYIHLTAQFRYAIDVVDRAVRSRPSVT